jgi:hypothetical protein
MNFKTLTISVKNYIGIFTGIALDLLYIFHSIAIFTILILPIDEYEKSCQEDFQKDLFS